MPRSEAQIVAASLVPVTQAMIEDGLRRIAVRPGSVVLVHARVSAFGWVPGHAETVVHAILSVLGPNGTLMAPAFTGHLSEPSRWRNPPVPEPWWPIIRAEMPAYDPLLTRSRGIGAVPEVVRTWPGALRSMHPQCSFAAIGSHSLDLLGGQRLDAEFGPDSPLERLVQADGTVLFLGSDWDTATVFHLAEHISGVQNFRQDGAPMVTNGLRRWVEFRSPDYDSSAFQDCGEAFEAAHPVAQTQIGAARVRLFDARTATVFAQDWLTRNRRR